MSDFDFADEAYIDDIPFETETIFNLYSFKRAMEANFNFEEDRRFSNVFGCY